MLPLLFKLIANEIPWSSSKKAPAYPGQRIEIVTNIAQPLAQRMNTARLAMDGMT
jgi:hypothetical protein